MVLVRTDFTDPSQDASATNNQIISGTYHSSFSGFSYFPGSRTGIPGPMPTTNAEISILNSFLNFVGGKSLTHECVDCIFYMSPSNHPIENTLCVCRSGKGSVATFSILSIPARL